MIRNNARFEIFPDAKVWLDVFCFGNISKDDRIEWIESSNKSSIKSGGTGKFKFHIPIKEIMHIVILIKDKELRKGIMLDDMHIAYTWEYWHPNRWTWWQVSRNHVAESFRMQELLDKFNECLDKHTTNQDYEKCLAR